MYWVFSSSRASRPLGLLLVAVFINMGSCGSQNFKTPLFQQFSSDFNQDFILDMLAMVEYKLLPFGDVPEIKKKITLEFYYHRTICNMNLQNATSPTLLIGVDKLFEDIGYHGVIEVISFLGNQPAFTKFLSLWNFNMRINWEIVICDLSRKRLILERNGWQFGTRNHMVSICRVLIS